MNELCSGHNRTRLKQIRIGLEKDYNKFTRNWFSLESSEIWMSCVEIENFKVGDEVVRAAGRHHDLEQDSLEKCST